MEIKKSAQYVGEMSEAEVQRLLTLASIGAPHVRTSCLRMGIDQGAKALDVGCGALGALNILAEIVGPSGVVVGIDKSPEAIAAARNVLDTIGLGYVQVRLADANEVGPSDLCPPGPFDAAYVRFFLIHQAEPAATLRKVALLVRPGGAIIVHEPFRSVFLSADNPIGPLLARALEMIAEVIGAAGGSPDVADRMLGIAREAGLEYAYQYAFCNFTSGTAHANLVAASLRAAKKAILALQLHSEAEVDEAAAALDVAAQSDLGMMLGLPVIAAELRVPETPASSA